MCIQWHILLFNKYDNTFSLLGVAIHHGFQFCFCIHMFSLKHLKTLFTGVFLENNLFIFTHIAAEFNNKTVGHRNCLFLRHQMMLNTPNIANKCILANSYFTNYFLKLLQTL